MPCQAGCRTVDGNTEPEKKERDLLKGFMRRIIQIKKYEGYAVDFLLTPEDIDSLTRTLCTFIKLNRDSVKEIGGLASWWKVHEELDRIREENERRALENRRRNKEAMARRKELIASAIKKLTDEEREALCL